MKIQEFNYLKSLSQCKLPNELYQFGKNTNCVTLRKQP